MDYHYLSPFVTFEGVTNNLKEWDYYLVSNGRFALALTIADNGYMGLDSISLLDLEEKWEIRIPADTILDS